MIWELYHPFLVPHGNVMATHTYMEMTKREEQPEGSNFTIKGLFLVISQCILFCSVLDHFKNIWLLYLQPKQRPSSHISWGTSSYRDCPLGCISYFSKCPILTCVYV